MAYLTTPEYQLQKLKEKKKQPNCFIYFHIKKINMCGLTRISHINCLSGFVFIYCLVIKMNAYKCTFINWYER